MSDESALADGNAAAAAPNGSSSPSSPVKSAAAPTSSPVAHNGASSPSCSTPVKAAASSPVAPASPAAVTAATTPQKNTSTESGASPSTTASNPKKRGQEASANTDTTRNSAEDTTGHVAKKSKPKKKKTAKKSMNPEEKAKAKAASQKLAEDNICAVCGEIDVTKHLTIFGATDTLPKMVLHSTCSNDDLLMLSAAQFKKHYGASKDVVEAYKITRTADGPVRFGNAGIMVLEHEFRDNYKGSNPLIASLAKIRADIRRERKSA